MSLRSLVEQFSSQRVLVLGDVILDHYVEGSVSRTSPEAPVPILNVAHEDWLPGGAANVAKNLVSAGASVELIGLRGDDEAGLIVDRLLNESPKLTSYLFLAKDRPTILKTRCVAQGQQMLRLDRESVCPAEDAIYTKILTLLKEKLFRIDGVILSDYGKGFLTPDFLQVVIETVKAAGKKIIVDPKGRDYTRYHGVSVITPNQQEAADASGIAIADNASCRQAAEALHRQVAAEAIVITRGPTGVSVFPGGDQPSHISAKARQVYDVTGAGDTFIAVLGLGLFTGAPVEIAAELGNMAGGFVVGLSGVATISQKQLLSLCDGHADARQKVLDTEELEQVCRSHRQNGDKVVLTNGFFDLLHYGHFRLLEKARGMGNALIVAINSDESTRRLKGDPRPVLRADERAAILSSLPFVDYVTVFDDDTPEALLKRIKPDVLVKGGPATTTISDVVGHQIVETYGGTIRIVPIEGSTSISEMLERVRVKEAIPAKETPHQ